MGAVILELTISKELDSVDKDPLIMVLWTSIKPMTMWIGAISCQPWRSTALVHTCASSWQNFGTGKRSLHRKTVTTSLNSK